jgi:hypothetical protein
MMNENQAEETQPITFKKVQGTVGFLADMFTSRFAVTGESMIFSIAEQICKEYRGGVWDFYEGSNGAKFLVPSFDPNEKFNVTIAGNWFQGELSATAFGIVVTLTAVNNLLWNVYEADDALGQKLQDHFYALRDLAFDHEESNLILGAID